MTIHFTCRNQLIGMKERTMMYRGYVVQGGRIIAGEDIDSATLDDAKTAGYKMIAERQDPHQIDGIEIWQGSLLLYKSGAE